MRAGRSLKNGASSAFTPLVVIRRAHAFQIFRAALLHDVEPRTHIRGQQRDGRRHDFAERPRALAAAEHEQTQADHSAVGAS